MNSSSMCSSSWVLSIINSLLQSGFPAESQVLTESLLQCRLLSLSTGLPGAPRSLFQKGLSMESLPPLGIQQPLVWTHPGAAGWTSAPPWISMGGGGILALAPGAFPPPPSPLIFMSPGLFLPHVLLPPPRCSCEVFSPFLIMLSQRGYHHCSWTEPWPAAVLSWSWWALDFWDTVKVSGIFLWKPAL